MSHSCSICSIRGNFKKYYSKFIGSIDEDASYYCDNCYNEEAQREELLIKFSIQNGENIASIVKQKHIIDYINPTSSTTIIKPMNIYKIVSENINGIEKNFVMIDLEEYNNYMLYVACSNKKLIDNEKLLKIKEQQEKQEETERKRIDEINNKQRRDVEREAKHNEKIELEVKINKYNNDKIKQEKEELKEQFKEVFQTDPNSKIKKCDFCVSFKIFPYHFKDENNKPYLRAYTKDKKQEKANCCIDCFEEAENKKEERKLNHTHYCEICDKKFIAYTEELYTQHLKTTQHKKKEAKLKNKNDLSLLSIKELHSICSKSIDEKGLCRINNYTRLKKVELLDKMNSIYDLLIF